MALVLLVVGEKQGVVLGFCGVLLVLPTRAHVSQRVDYAGGDMHPSGWGSLIDKCWVCVLKVSKS